MAVLVFEAAGLSFADPVLDRIHAYQQMEKEKHASRECVIATTWSNYCATAGLIAGNDAAQHQYEQQLAASQNSTKREKAKIVRDGRRSTAAIQRPLYADLKSDAKALAKFGVKATPAQCKSYAAREQEVYAACELPADVAKPPELEPIVCGDSSWNTLVAGLKAYCNDAANSDDECTKMVKTAQTCASATREDVKRISQYDMMSKDFSWPLPEYNAGIDHDADDRWFEVHFVDGVVVEIQSFAPSPGGAELD